MDFPLLNFDYISNLTLVFDENTNSGSVVIILLSFVSKRFWPSEKTNTLRTKTDTGQMYLLLSVVSAIMLLVRDTN